MDHPYERPPIPIANLTAEDHVLLAHIADEQFALRHVVGNSIHLHPAQQTLLTLTQWLKLPHIAAAARQLQADLREYESVRLEFLQRHSIDGLVDAMHSASRNLKLLEESRTHNIQHTRAVEELRLAAQALNRATRPNQPACTPKPRHSASHHAVVKANSRGSSAKPTPPENSLSISTRSPDVHTTFHTASGNPERELRADIGTPCETLISSAHPDGVLVTSSLDEPDPTYQADRSEPNSAPADDETIASDASSCDDTPGSASLLPDSLAPS
ncbi:MAG: hypothetical protein KGS45_09290 [Planctomycetes bacterium]|nr:hypothetical protein [Planctomycetota bacterium]